MKYILLTKEKVSQDVLNRFDCGHPDFNYFLQNDANECAANGKGVTYILVDDEEDKDGNKRIYFFKNVLRVFFQFFIIRLKATSLYYENQENTVFNISCAEIKYFAIAKQFQKAQTGKQGTEKYYSTCFFEILLADLYQMSTSVIGFTGIFLRANENGEKLYRRKKFIDAKEYIIPYEEDDELGKCTPMYLSINDNLYSIFGCED